MGELLEVKEVLTDGEWALASRPGEKKVQFFCCSPSNKHDRGGGAESLFCFVTFAAQPSRSLVRTERFEVKKMQLFFFKGPVIIVVHLKLACDYRQGSFFLAVHQRVGDQSCAF